MMGCGARATSRECTCATNRRAIVRCSDLFRRKTDSRSSSEMRGDCGWSRVESLREDVSAERTYFSDDRHVLSKGSVGANSGKRPAHLHWIAEFLDYRTFFSGGCRKSCPWSGRCMTWPISREAVAMTWGCGSSRNSAGRARSLVRRTARPDSQGVGAQTENTMVWWTRGAIPHRGRRAAGWRKRWDAARSWLRFHAR